MSGTGHTTKNVFATGDQYIDGIVSGSAWGGTNFLFSFPTSATEYNYSGEAATFQTISGQQKNAIRTMLSDDHAGSANNGFSIEGFTNVAFSETTAVNAHLRFADSSQPSTAWAYYPSFSNSGGDTWFGNSSTFNNPVVGNYSWLTHMHEIGHALGLKHAHETNRFGAVPSEQDSLEYTVMSYRSYVNGSVTSGYTNETYGYPQTYMVNDIAALQHMYGADFTTNSGDTTYKWNPVSGDTLVNGSVGIDASGNRIFAAIWDGGGTDTYDLSLYSNDLTISLQAGGHSIFSSAQQAYLGGGNHARGNIFNALQFQGNTASLIENAKGGSGNDNITGNQANNQIESAGGNDTIYGGLGNDTIYGGVGDDKLYGEDGNDTLHGGIGNDKVYSGKGNDTVYLGDGDDYVKVGGGLESFFGGAGKDYISYYASTGGVTINLETNTVSRSWASNDTIEGFESASGSKTGDDIIYGTTGSNTIRTYGGKDKVYAGKGTDVVYLGDGDDYVKVGGGLESFYGGAGKDYISYYASTGGVTINLQTNTVSRSWASNDTIDGFESASGSKTGDDIIYGTTGSNTIKTYGGKDKVYAGKGTDKVDLGDGDDYVRVGGGVETFIGGAGKDYISYYDSTGGITIDLEANTVSGSWASNDTIDGFESVSGSKTGGDTIYGTSGSNTLKSFGGDDVIYGRGGADRLEGGTGTDLLFGGSGADVFHFDKNDDHDTIKDFEDDVDTIQLDNFTFGAGQDAFTFATQVGVDVVFDFGSGDMLTVENATILQLQNDLEMV